MELTTAGRVPPPLGLAMPCRGRSCAGADGPPRWAWAGRPRSGRPKSAHAFPRFFPIFPARKFRPRKPAEKTSLRYNAAPRARALTRIQSIPYIVSFPFADSTNQQKAILNFTNTICKKGDIFKYTSRFCDKISKSPLIIRISIISAKLRITPPVKHRSSKPAHRRSKSAAPIRDDALFVSLSKCQNCTLALHFGLRPGNCTFMRREPHNCARGAAQPPRGTTENHTTTAGNHIDVAGNCRELHDNAPELHKNWQNFSIFPEFAGFQVTNVFCVFPALFTVRDRNALRALLYGKCKSAIREQRTSKRAVIFANYS